MKPTTHKIPSGVHKPLPDWEVFGESIPHLELLQDVLKELTERLYEKYPEYKQTVKAIKEARST